MKKNLYRFCSARALIQPLTTGDTSPQSLGAGVHTNNFVQSKDGTMICDLPFLILFQTSPIGFYCQTSCGYSLNKCRNFQLKRTEIGLAAVELCLDQLVELQRSPRPPAVKREPLHGYGIGDEKDRRKVEGRMDMQVPSHVGSRSTPPL